MAETCGATGTTYGDGGEGNLKGERDSCLKPTAEAIGDV